MLSGSVSVSIIVLKYGRLIDREFVSIIIIMRIPETAILEKNPIATGRVLERMIL